MKKLFLILGLFLTFFPIVKAYPCSKEQTSRYEKLANQIQATYEYKEVNDEIVFDITFHNVNNDFYIVDYYNLDHLKTYENNGSGVIIADNYLPGNKYRFSILNKKKSCDTKIISEIFVTLPNYNKFYKDDICKDIGEFELCKKWVNNGGISYEHFLKSAKEYKEEKNEIPEELNNKIEENLFDKIRNFIAAYYVYIIITILILAIIIVYCVHRKRSKKYKW